MPPLRRPHRRYRRSLRRRRPPTRPGSRARPARSPKPPHQPRPQQSHPCIIGSIGDGVLISLNLISLASLAISGAILGQGSVGLTDQHRGETSPSVEVGMVGEPNLGTAGLMSRSGSGAAVSAFTGRASSIGGLSVPPSWATPLAVRQVAAALPSTAGPIIMQNSQTSPDSPYTGMALASLVGSSMAGLAFRGAPAASAAATTPAANKLPAATVVAPNKPASAAVRAATPPAPPAAPKAAFPSAVPAAMSAAGIPADAAAELAATLARMPGATIIVIPPAPE